MTLQMDDCVAFDAARDVKYAHHDPFFDDVVHVFDADWHGIRSASGCAPGHKMSISHKRTLTGHELRYIFGQIYNYGLKYIVFQGFSSTAAFLADLIRKTFGDRVKIFCVTHVSPAQFEHLFELEMLGQLRELTQIGVIDRVASVKPNFEAVFPGLYPNTIVNFWPNIVAASKKDRYYTGEVFVPLENTFRKNLYVNILACHQSDLVNRIFTVNEPSLLERVAPMPKLQRIPFQKRQGMLELCSRVELLMNVTFAECQPMTQLEALAAGTPCLTGHLDVEEFDDLALVRLCSVRTLDNPALLSRKVDEVLTLRRDDPERLDAMVAEARAAIREIAVNAYKGFLES